MDDCYQLTIRLPRALADEFKDLAKEHDRSLAAGNKASNLGIRQDASRHERGPVMTRRTWRTLAAVLALLLLVVALLTMPAPRAEADPPYHLNAQLTDTAGYLSSEGVDLIKGELADLYANRQIRLFVAIIKQPNDYADQHAQNIASWAATTAQGSGLGGTDCLLVLSPGSSGSSGSSYGAPGTYALWPAPTAGSPIDDMVKARIEPAVLHGNLGTATEAAIKGLDRIGVTPTTTPAPTSTPVTSSPGSPGNFNPGIKVDTSRASTRHTPSLFDQYIRLEWLLVRDGDAGSSRPDPSLITANTLTVLSHSPAGTAATPEFMKRDVLGPDDDMVRLASDWTPGLALRLKRATVRTLRRPPTGRELKSFA
jgi:hypothetical protein